MPRKTKEQIRDDLDDLRKELQNLDEQVSAVEVSTPDIDKPENIDATAKANLQALQTLET